MDVTTQQEVLGIDEILRNIYGFVLGTDLNRITKNMQIQMHLVSQHFNKCFIAYLKSAPLKLHYDRRVCHIVKWMKSHEITIRLFELSICVLGCELLDLNVDFTGLDLSNLSVLHFKSWPSSTYSYEKWQNCLFSEASSVTHLVVWDGHNSTSSSVVMYKNFLLYFPILKSLDAVFGYSINADINSVKGLIEMCPQLERLVYHNLIGDYTRRSHYLKFLNLSACDLDSICLDCPSLEKLVCRNPVVIGNTSGSVLAEEFGNDEVAFMEENKAIYDMSPVHMSRPYDLASVSIIPSDSIVSTANDLFRVGNDCRIILFTDR